MTNFRGIDSLNCPLGGLVMASACAYGSSSLGLFTLIIPCAPMFLSSWEQYHTKTLYLGYFNGPCEGIIIACIFMGISGIYGPSFYHQPATEALGLDFIDKSIMVYDIFVAMCLIAFFGIHVPSW
jgi:ethanolaminephosphotransferase